MTQRVAIVGAGLSGLAAARHLQRAGVDVTVFDKGRRPGGRANTRVHAERRFDHGAQYFTVRGHAVRPLLRTWTQAGLMAEWTGRIVHIDETGVEPAKPATRYVGVPGMVDLALHLADGLDVRAGVRIESVRHSRETWTLTAADGRLYAGFDTAVVAVPAPQAVPLLAESAALQAQAADATMEPCWAAMLSFDRPIDAEFDAAFVRVGPLSWIARDSSKPGRPDDEAWVLHLGPEWSRAHAHAHPDAVASFAHEALAKLVPAVSEPVFRRAHRWGYALASAPGGDILFDPVLRLAAGGDWCAGGRVEGALTSGIEIAERITGEATSRHEDRGAAPASP